jgi:plastocyanin
MFLRLISVLLWVSLLAAVGAGSYFFFVGENNSYMCRSVRWVKDTEPITPIPIGFCGSVDPRDPRNLPPPVRPMTADASVYFKRNSNYGEYPYKQTILIKAGCVFDPPAPQMKSNTTVTWLNQDDRPHAIASDTSTGLADVSGAFRSPPIPPQGKYVMFVNQAGSFTYRCADKPEAKGTFSVVQW